MAIMTWIDGKQYEVTAVLPPSPTPPPAPPTPPVPVPPAIPATAKRIDLLPLAWPGNHDAGTAGSATGSTAYPFTLGGKTVRQFQCSLAGEGGFIWHTTALADASAYRNLCYHSVVQSPDWSNIAALEQDFNWVDAVGNVTIIGQQLDGRSSTAQVTKVANGTHWVSTNVTANPLKLAPNVPHTIDWYAQHDGNGNVIYLGVFIDGVWLPFTTNGTQFCFDPLKWAKNILQVQFQVDGLSQALKQITSVIYALELTAIVW